MSRKNGKDLGVPAIWRLLVGSLMGVVYSFALLAIQLQILGMITSYLYSIISLFLVFGIPIVLMKEMGIDVRKNRNIGS
jgi:hypothetical protein